MTVLALRMGALTAFRRARNARMMRKCSKASSGKMSKSFEFGVRIAAITSAVSLLLLASMLHGPKDTSNLSELSNSRSLLQETVEGSEATCTINGGLGVLVWTFAILYTFLGLAIICDDYFVDSLEVISDKLSLSPDVAGATFMAAGSSAPELFTSVADAFATQSDIGPGTIVGSAVYNLAVIPGLSAAATGNTLDLDWRPLARDSIFYLLSILLLTGFILTGREVTIAESVVMLFLYGTYILVMSRNERMFKWMCPKTDTGYDEQVDDDESSQYAPDLNSEDFPSDVPMQQLPISRVKEQEYNTGSPRNVSPRVRFKAAVHSVIVARRVWPALGKAHRAKLQASQNPKPLEEDGDVEPFEPIDLWSAPEGSLKDKIFWYLAWPYQLAFKYTVPNLKVEKWQNWYFLSFLSCVAWIGGLSVIMVQGADQIGCILKISPALMGIVVLAAGTSVPDTIASVIVAKDGEGDMAVSNAIGSNVFDILLGLGLPWLISNFVYGKPVAVSKSDGAGPVVFALFQLIIILVAVMGILKFKNWQLSPKTGYVLVSLHVLYITVNILKPIIEGN